MAPGKIQSLPWCIFIIFPNIIKYPACRDRIRENGFKLKKSRLLSDIRKKFFAVNGGRHWKRLPSQVISIPESVQDKISFEQPDLVKYVPVHGEGTGINRFSAWKVLHLI